eukprot:604781-Karenia_brevis.AAC.1
MVVKVVPRVEDVVELKERVKVILEDSKEKVKEKDMEGFHQYHNLGEGKLMERATLGGAQIMAREAVRESAGSAG